MLSCRYDTAMVLMSSQQLRHLHTVKPRSANIPAGSFNWTHWTPREDWGGRERQRRQTDKHDVGKEGDLEVS